MNIQIEPHIDSIIIPENLRVGLMVADAINPNKRNMNKEEALKLIWGGKTIVWNRCGQQNPDWKRTRKKISSINGKRALIAIILDYR
jgi:hypothetical protein